jgi:hypothetical protein
VLVGVGLRRATLMVDVEHWFEELKQRAPAGGK